MSANSKMESASLPASAPGENYEPRQTHPSEDYTPDPSKSLPLSKERQALVDDILDLYSCKPTVRKVKRYTSDCVYDDQFVYANDRYKMAGQWFALPKLFKDSKTEKYQIVKNEPGLIQFRNEQVSVLLSSSSSLNLLLTRWCSHGPSKSSPKPPPSTPSSPYLSTHPPSTATLSRSSITRIRRMTRTIRTRVWGSASRNGRQIRL